MSETILLLAGVMAGYPSLASQPTLAQRASEPVMNGNSRRSQPAEEGASRRTNVVKRRRGKYGNSWKGNLPTGAIETPRGGDSPLAPCYDQVVSSPSFNSCQSVHDPHQARAPPGLS